MAEYRRRARKTRAKHDDRYTEVGRIGDPCTYCGVIAETYDHVPPLHYVDRISEVEAELFSLRKFPCCAECNRTLGGLLLPYRPHRKDYLRRKFRERYAHILSIPEWDEEELAEMDGSLRDDIKAHLRLKEWVLERLKRLLPY